MKIKVVDKWKDDINGTDDLYCELCIDNSEACCVKCRKDGLMYVIECYDGNEVYLYPGGADFPLRKLTRDEEKEILEFAYNILKKGDD